jgi:hypothetical protein
METVLGIDLQMEMSPTRKQGESPKGQQLNRIGGANMSEPETPQR